MITEYATPEDFTTWAARAQTMTVATLAQTFPQLDSYLDDNETLQLY